MLKLNTDRQFKARVDVFYPGDADDEFDVGHFEATFRLLKKSELREIAKAEAERIATLTRLQQEVEAKAKAGEEVDLSVFDGIADAEDKVEATLRRVLVGATGVGDADGTALTGRSALDAIFQDELVVTATHATYWKRANEVARKNSRTSRAGMPSEPAAKSTPIATH